LDVLGEDHFGFEEEKDPEIQLGCWQKYQTELRTLKRNCVSVSWAGRRYLTVWTGPDYFRP